jgi:hypothetical protein
MFLLPGHQAGWDPARVAEVIVIRSDGSHRRGSGYLITPSTVMTAAHVLERAQSVLLQFNAGMASAWTATATGWRPGDDRIALISIPPTLSVRPAILGALGDRAAVLDIEVAGFPRWKLRRTDGAEPVTGDGAAKYRAMAHEAGTLSTAADRREGGAQITVTPPRDDPEDAWSSPWHGMSGAPVFYHGRIVAIVDASHIRESWARLSVVRVDWWLQGLVDDERVDVLRMLGLRNVADLAEAPGTAAEVVQSAYREQVRDLAPSGRLLDREDELWELTQFCGGDEPYARWEADAWAGKTALLATFVLDPPAGVRVVWFFVTSRLASQTDSTAFTEALLHQLRALTDDELPLPDSPGARDAHRRRLLRKAAAQARAAGERLVLVVDGIDEDRTAPGTPSIAALLPKQCDDGLRVVVARRPDPPLPEEVPADHPLRSCPVWRLAPSPHARDREREAREELDAALRPGGIRRDIVGLVTASGGGLTLADLEQLTDQPRDIVDDLFRGAFGRTVGARTDPTVDGLAPVYLFTHGTLSEQAVTKLGPRQLTQYRDRIISWADGFRTGWPSDTPHYLLTGYPRMLSEAPDRMRLRELAVDTRRHDWMRNQTGGDAAAFAEIQLALQLLLQDSTDVDLLGVFQLAICRDQLANHAAGLPHRLPAVWAALGDPERAMALAGSLTDRYQRWEALILLAQALARSGEVERTVQVAQSIDGWWDQRVVWTALIEALAGAGDCERAEQVWRMITGRLPPDAEQASVRIAGPTEALVQREASTALVRSLVRAGRQAAAGLVVASIDDLPERRAALTVLVESLVLTGQAAEAEKVADATDDRGDRREAGRALADALVAAGDLDRALEVAGRLVDRWSERRVAALRAERLAATGELTRVRSLVRRFTDQRDQVYVLIAAVAALVLRDDVDRAESLATISSSALLSSRSGLVDALLRGGRQTSEGVVAGRLARVLGEHLCSYVGVAGTDIADLDSSLLNGHPSLVPALGHVIRALVRTGIPERAEAIVDAVTHRGSSIRLRTDLVQALAQTGAEDRAQRAVARIADRFDREAVLTALVREVVDLGRPDKAAALASGDQPAGLRAYAALIDTMVSAGAFAPAEQLARGIPERFARDQALIAVARAMAVAGRLDLAEPVAGSLRGFRQQAEALAQLAEVTTGTDRDQARRLAIRAESVARTDPDYHQTAWDTLSLVDALAQIGDRERADAVAGRLTDPRLRVHQLAAQVSSLVVLRDHDRAADLAAGADAAARVSSEATERVTAGLAEGLVALGRALAALVKGLAATEGLPTAAAVARPVTHPDLRDWAFAALGEAAASAGDYRGAEAIAGIVAGPHRTAVVTALVVALVAHGYANQAERVVGDLFDRLRRGQTLTTQRTDDEFSHKDLVTNPDVVTEVFPQPENQIELLAALALAAAHCGDHVRSAALLEWGTRICRSSAGSGVALVETMVAVGRPDDAREFALARDSSWLRAECLLAVVNAVADTDQHERAEEFTELITEPYWKSMAMAKVVVAADRAGQRSRARRMAAAAEELALDLTEPHLSRVMIALARTVAETGDEGTARRLLAKAVSTGRWRTALPVLARLDPVAVRALADGWLLGRDGTLL